MIKIQILEELPLFKNNYLKRNLSALFSTYNFKN